MAINWIQTKEKLLNSRFCDLNLSLEGHPIMEAVAQLYFELEMVGLKVKPPVWISEEWFVPDGGIGIAIPFYLLDPHLTRLERQMIGEAEGSGQQALMRYLRHEAGHAIDNAYGLRRFNKRQKIFGSYRAQYPKAYRPQPYCRDFVKHLGNGYGQSHPDEDFAETFAVWLKAGGNPCVENYSIALQRKFECVEEGVGWAIANGPVMLKHFELDRIDQSRKTLRSFYNRKQKYLHRSGDESSDLWLKRLFKVRRDPKAKNSSNFIQSNRRQVRGLVARALGVHCYQVDEVLKRVNVRSKQLQLDLDVSSGKTKAEFLDFVTDQALEDIRRGRNKIVL